MASTDKVTTLLIESIILAISGIWTRSSKKFVVASAASETAPDNAVHVDSAASVVASHALSAQSVMPEIYMDV